MQYNEGNCQFVTRDLSLRREMVTG